jgi:hypothetical protein
MTEQRAEDWGAVSPRTPLSQGVHSGGVHVNGKTPIFDSESAAETYMVPVSSIQVSKARLD